MSDDSHLREETIRSEHLFKGRLLDVYRDEIRLPDGRISTREYTLHPGAVVMIPVLPNGQIMLIRQFRYPAKKVMIELPAGKLDEGEDYRTTAYRELEEEIGYKAGKITYVAEIDPCVGYSDEHMWITWRRICIKQKRIPTMMNSSNRFRFLWNRRWQWSGRDRLRM